MFQWIQLLNTVTVTWTDQVHEPSPGGSKEWIVPTKLARESWLAKSHNTIAGS